ncbi:hypothetical protein ACIA74_39985 [Streptomyces sp. NPDC051658]|uniref:hypothetical protein n=1 Tax=Streptomyces sp. NPDC051658 TaxID=3365667 RepID=UPI0037A7EB41
MGNNGERADSGPNALADVFLRKAEGQLPMTLEGTVRCVQNRARLVHALHERLGPAMVRKLVVRWSGEEFVVTNPAAIGHQVTVLTGNDRITALTYRRRLV